MVALNALPPVPALAGDGWRDLWLRAIDELVPWSGSIEQQNDGPFWRQGSLRPDYHLIEVADDARRRLGRPLPQLALLRHGRAPDGANPAADGAVVAHEPDRRGPGSRGSTTSAS